VGALGEGVQYHVRDPAEGGNSRRSQARRAARRQRRDAKGKVAALARGGGLNPIDVGPLKRARELEAAGLLHMGVQNELGTGFASALTILA
jgi:predicted dinucleotide-binding enzyme